MPRDELDNIRAKYESALRDATAWQVCSQLAGHFAPLLIPHVTKRIAVTNQNGTLLAQLQDAYGVPTTVEALRSEWANEPGFSNVIRGVSVSEQDAHARKVREMLGTT